MKKMAWIFIFVLLFGCTGEVATTEQGREKIRDGGNPEFTIEQGCSPRGNKFTLPSGEETYDGDVVDCWSNGNKKYQGLFSRGVREGEHCRWYESGTIKSKEIWENDIPIKIEWWHSNGQKESECQRNRETTKECGLCRKWDPLGRLIEEKQNPPCPR